MPKLSATNENIDTDETSVESKACEVVSTTRKDEARAILTAFPDILTREQVSKKEVTSKAVIILGRNLILPFFSGLRGRRAC